MTTGKKTDRKKTICNNILVTDQGKETDRFPHRASGGGCELRCGGEYSLSGPVLCGGQLRADRYEFRHE